MLDIRKRTLYGFYVFLRLLIIPINQLIYIRLCMTTEKWVWANKIEASV